MRPDQAITPAKCPTPTQTPAESHAIRLEPASKDQERLATLSKLGPEYSLAYNIAGMFRLHAPFFLEHAKQAIAQIIARHSSLRSIFVENGPRWQRLVLPAASLALPCDYVDFSDLPDPEAAADAMYLQSLNKEFSLFAKPPCQFTICKTAAQQHRIILTFHHVIADFQTVMLFSLEFQYFYEIALGHALAPLPPMFDSDCTAYAKLADYENHCLAKYQTSMQERLANIPRLHFKPHLATARTMRLGHFYFDIANDTVAQLKASASRENTTVLAILLSAFQLQLQALTGQERFMIGLPVDARPGKPHRGAFGYLSKPNFVTFDARRYPQLRQLVADMQQQVKQAVLTRFLPTSEFYAHASAQQIQIPSLQVLFNYLPINDMNLPDSQTLMEPIYGGLSHSDMDLWFSAYETTSGMKFKLEYSSDLFQAHDLAQFEAQYLARLRQICADFAHPLHTPAASAPRLSSIVVASFTLTPLSGLLARWQTQMGHTLDVQLQAYQQVIQTLLTPLAPGHVQTLSVCLRLADFFRPQSESTNNSTHHSSTSHEALLTQLCDDLAAAFHHSIRDKQIPHQVIFCPVSAPEPTMQAASARLATSLRAISGLTVHEFGDPELATLEFDPQAEEIAHIPYTEHGYQTLALVMLEFNWHHSCLPPKVFVLDCDNTLWRGVIGEDGMVGIHISPAHRQFQAQLIALQRAGLLLALASKNNEEDALQVFEQHPDMLLRPEHLVAHRINWRAKAENIVSMAEELNLDVNSFVFFDDNPAEIGQVRQLLPQMLTLQVPTDEVLLGRWLSHLCLFALPAFKDKTFDRTLSYQQESARKQFKHSQLSMANFIDALELQADFFAVDTRTMARASELTLRTNQFNLTGTRLSEAALEHWLLQPDQQGMLISCRDRFGDYGTIGLLLLRDSAPMMEVCNILLSCRVLGRGMEAMIVHWLDQWTQQHYCHTLRFDYRDTGKNLPGRQFLQALGQFCGATLLPGKEQSATLTVATVKFQDIDSSAFMAAPDEAEPSSDPASASETHSATEANTAAVLDRAADAVTLAALAELGWQQTQAGTLANTAPLKMARAAPPHGASGIKNQREIEARLGKLWQITLDPSLVQPKNHFFNSGGSSLAAVGLLIGIRREFGLQLTMEDIYRNAVLQEMAHLISQRLAAAAGMADDTQNSNATLYQDILHDIELSLQDVPFQHHWHTLSQPAASSAAQPLAVLLTGVTGFVGSHILKELLKQRHVQVSCIVRASDSTAAWQRLLTTLREYHITLGPDELARVRTLPGDLELPKLGLGLPLWQQMEQETHLVLHCGANVNFFASYQQLRAANVESTRELLRLCATGQPKKLIHISTIGVMHGRDHMAMASFPENMASGTPQGLPTGYQQSKWACEKLIGRAIERGVQAHIIRLGTVAASATTGAINRADLFVHLFNSQRQIGAMPQMRPIDLLPVDFIAKAIVAITLKAPAAGQVFHLLNPNTLSWQKLHDTANLVGVQLDALPFAQWRERVMQFFHDHPQHPFALYEPLFHESGNQSPSFIEILLLSPPADTSQTQQILQSMGLSFPLISPELLQHYQQVMEQQGLLAADSSAMADQADNLFYFTEEMHGFVMPGQADTTGLIDDLACVAAHHAGQAAHLPISIDFTGHVRDHQSLFTSKRAYLNGKVLCPAIHALPLQVLGGYFEIAPFDGYRPKHPDSLLFLEYEVELAAADGKQYRLRGHKVTQHFPRMFFEVAELLIRIDRTDHQVDENPMDGMAQRTWCGKIGIPFAQLFHDQITRMRFRPGLDAKQQFICQTVWLSFLTHGFLKNYLRLFLRRRLWSWADSERLARQIPGLDQLWQQGRRLLPIFKRLGIFSRLFEPKDKP